VTGRWTELNWLWALGRKTLAIRRGQKLCGILAGKVLPVSFATWHVWSVDGSGTHNRWINNWNMPSWTHQLGTLPHNVAIKFERFHKSECTWQITLWILNWQQNFQVLNIEMSKTDVLYFNVFYYLNICAVFIYFILYLCGFYILYILIFIQRINILNIFFLFR